LAVARYPNINLTQSLGKDAILCKFFGTRRNRANSAEILPHDMRGYRTAMLIDCAY
jgi:hypothetical protein